MSNLTFFRCQSWNLVEQWTKLPVGSILSLICTLQLRHMRPFETDHSICRMSNIQDGLTSVAAKNSAVDGPTVYCPKHYSFYFSVQSSIIHSFSDVVHNNFSVGQAVHSKEPLSLWTNISRSVLSHVVMGLRPPCLRRSSFITRSSSCWSLVTNISPSPFLLKIW